MKHGLAMMLVATVACGARQPRLPETGACNVIDGWVRLAPSGPETPPVLVLDLVENHDFGRLLIIVWPDGRTYMRTRSDVRFGHLPTATVDAWLGQLPALEREPPSQDLQRGWNDPHAPVTRISVRRGDRWLRRDVMGIWPELLAIYREIQPELPDEPAIVEIDPDQGPGIAFTGAVTTFVPPPAIVARMFSSLYREARRLPVVSTPTERRPSYTVASYDVTVSSTRPGMADKVVDWPSGVAAPDLDPWDPFKQAEGRFAYPPRDNAALADFRRTLAVEPAVKVRIGPHALYEVTVHAMWEGERTYHRAMRCGEQREEAW